MYNLRGGGIACKTKMATFITRYTVPLDSLHAPSARGNHSSWFVVLPGSSPPVSKTLVPVALLIALWLRELPRHNLRDTISVLAGDVNITAQ